MKISLTLTIKLDVEYEAERLTHPLMDDIVHTLGERVRTALTAQRDDWWPAAGSIDIDIKADTHGELTEDR